MNNERYQVSGVPIKGGERVTGYLVGRKSRFAPQLTRTYHISNEYGELTGIDPDTIEFVAIKPMQEKTLVGDYRCPNCNAAFIAEFGTTPFCGNCGQALDWNDPT